MANGGQGGSSSRWKLQDLQDLEQYGLAAELESTKLGGRSLQSDGPVCVGEGAMVDVEQNHHDFETYNMSDVLSELLTEDSELFQGTLLNIASSPPPLVTNRPGPSTSQRVSAILKAPTAHCIKKNQEEITYVNKGLSYELHVNYSGGDQPTDVIFKSVLLLKFSELRLKKCEGELFDLWINDHPMERLIEMDNVGCDGLTSVENVADSFSMITFKWSSRSSVIVAFKVNCLSSEFAARKHGGEKGIPLCLQLDTCSLDGLCNASCSATETGTLIERLACSIKVFKDKGADRKQRQEQLKMEKMSLNEQANYHTSQIVSPLYPLSLLTLDPESPEQQATPTTVKQPSERGSPYQMTTPTRPLPTSVPSSKIDYCLTVEHTHAWLLSNRFGQFISLFANYTGQDLLRLSRRDLVDLCGPADGIRLYNTLRSPTVRVVYVTMGTDKENQVCQAICLECLTAQELGAKVADKLNIPPHTVASLVRLTSTGILVLVDDIVVHNIRDEECFLVRAIKQEDEMYQVILQDHTPYEQNMSLRGTENRH